MARKIRVDQSFENALEEFEGDLFRLKVEYDKYFNGLERIEPGSEREKLRRKLRELELEVPNNTAQQHHLKALKARFMSFELFWQRNLVMIERGTHPKFRFRAELKERQRAEQAAAPAGPDPAELERKKKEDRAYHLLYDKYMEARRQCGQGADLDFEKVKEALQKQIAAIKEKTGARSVRFRIAVEEGKAKVKAVPVM